MRARGADVGAREPRQEVGLAVDRAEAEAVLSEQVESMVDGAGNLLTVTGQRQKPLDRKERKMLEKELKEMKKRGEDTYEIEERLGLIDT